MIIRWIGQGGYVIKTQSSEIVIDPYLSDIVNRVANCPRLVKAPIIPSEIKADAVICTHNHLDHLDPDSIMKMRDKQLLITTHEGKAECQKLGKYNLIALSVGERVVVGDVEITAVFADHTVEAFGVIIKAEGITLYFSGDTLYNEKLFSIAEYKPDITFICINGRLGNMNVNEAIVIAREIGAKVNIPNHYGMFASNTEDPHNFTERLDGGFIMDFNKDYNVQDVLMKEELL